MNPVRMCGKAKRYSGGLLVMLVLTLDMITGCSNHHPLYPTHDELTERGFYAYVLAQGESSARGWSETLRIWSWDRHCKGVEPTETSNPVYVIYDGGLEPGLQIMVGPWNVAWNESRITTMIKLDTTWAESKNAEYYETEGYIKLRFEDVFGFPVQIGSGLPISDVVDLVNHLEYIGPPPYDVSNPWKCDN